MQMRARRNCRLRQSQQMLRECLKPRSVPLDDNLVTYPPDAKAVVIYPGVLEPAFFRNRRVDVPLKVVTHASILKHAQCGCCSAPSMLTPPAMSQAGAPTRRRSVTGSQDHEHGLRMANDARCPAMTDAV